MNNLEFTKINSIIINADNGTMIVYPLNTEKVNIEFSQTSETFYGENFTHTINTHPRIKIESVISEALISYNKNREEINV